MYSRILVPVDGSEASFGALNEAVQLAKQQGGELRLLHIVKAPMLDYGFSADDSSRQDIIAALSKIGKSILANANATVREQGLAPECLLIESVAGSAAAVILAQARQWPANLIVMGSFPGCRRRQARPAVQFHGRSARSRRLADPGAVGARDCGAGGTSGAQPGGASRIGLRVGSPAHRRSVALSLEEQLVKPLGLVVGQALQQ